MSITTWAKFATATREIATEAVRCISARGGEAMLATVRGDDPPRIHPVNVAVVDGHLYSFVITRSPKRVDLETDGRYAIHAHVDPAAPTEVELRGRAWRVDEPGARSRAAAAWAFGVDDTYVLFEFGIEAALLGARDSADDWPPRYTSWPGRRADATERSSATAATTVPGGSTPTPA